MTDTEDELAACARAMYERCPSFKGTMPDSPRWLFADLPPESREYWLAHARACVLALALLKDAMDSLEDALPFFDSLGKWAGGESSSAKQMRALLARYQRLIGEKT